MKGLLAKYGRHFWVVALAVSLFAWYDLLFDRGSLFDALMFSGLTYYFFLTGTGRLTNENDPFSK